MILGSLQKPQLGFWLEIRLSQTVAKLSVLSKLSPAGWAGLRTGWVRPVHERPGNFFDSKVNFKIKTCWIVAQFLVHKPVNFASLTDRCIDKCTLHSVLFCLFLIVTFDS